MHRDMLKFKMASLLLKNSIIESLIFTDLTQLDDNLHQAGKALFHPSQNQLASLLRVIASVLVKINCQSL